METPTSVAPVPPKTVLLHIGPAKTGTTTLQSALHNSRQALAANGVDYPPVVRHPRSAFGGAAFERPPAGYSADAHREWAALAAATRSSRALRTVLSSEVLAGASAQRAQTTIADLGGSVSVVVTLRPLAAILASRWQQYVKERMTLTYDEWLHEVFDAPDSAPARAFSRRYRTDRLVERWASAAGHDRMLVIALDPADRGMLLRTFEGLLDLPGGALAPDPTDANESLPAWSVDLLRVFNERFAAADLPARYYTRSVGEVTVPRLAAAPAQADDRISTPVWAVARANAMQLEINARLREMGVRVIGDLDDLVVPVPAADDPRPDHVSLDAAADFAFAAFIGAQDFRPRAADRPRADIPVRREQFALATASRRALLAALVRSLAPRRLRAAATALAHRMMRVSAMRRAARAVLRRASRG